MRNVYFLLTKNAKKLSPEKASIICAAIMICLVLFTLTGFTDIINKTFPGNFFNVFINTVYISSAIVTVFTIHEILYPTSEKMNNFYNEFILQH